jgi:hypothetical protein
MPEGKRVWDNYQEVARVQKAGSTVYVVGIGTRDGVRYINIREFYLRKRDVTWNPGRDGISIPLVMPLEENTKQILPYTNLMKVLGIAAERLEKMDLYDDAHAVYYIPKED